MDGVVVELSLAVIRPQALEQKRLKDEMRQQQPKRTKFQHNLESIPPAEQKFYSVTNCDMVRFAGS